MGEFMSFQVKKFNSIVASMINWASGATTKVTDFNPGSVVRTLMEALAMELEELYYQLLQATEEAIEEAIYRTFNFPRNPAEKATGTERFTRLSGTETLITIPQGTLVATTTDPAAIFETQAEETIPSISGTATGGSTTTLIDTTKNFVTEGIIIGSRVMNITDNGETQPAGVTSITSTTNPNDTLHFSALTNGASFAGGGDSYKVVVQYKDVSIQASVAGVSGNVSANSITVLRSSLSNISLVTNLSALTSGTDEETDLHRKGRFALYIQSLARATRGALEYAALTVPQIVAAKAVDDVRATVYKYAATGPVWTDITNAMRNPGDAAIKLFADAEVIHDALYIGADELFNYINMHLVTFGIIVGSPALPKWEYWNGSVWASLAVSDGTDDGTGPLTQDGTISWAPPSNWIATYVNNKLMLWVRLRIDDSGTTYSPTPTGDWCSLPPGFGYVYLYCHDGSGDLNATLKASVEGVVDLYRGCGIVVEVTAPVKTQPPVTATISVVANYDLTEIVAKVKQAVVDFLNAKVLGEDLYRAELYQLIMGVDDKAIANAILTLPAADIIMPSSGVLRADSTTVIIYGIQV